MFLIHIIHEKKSVKMWRQMMHNSESRIGLKLETHLAILIRSCSQKFVITQYLRFKNLKTIKKDIDKQTNNIFYIL